MWDEARERINVLAEKLNDNDAFRKLVKSEKSRKRLFIGASALAGALTFILFMDIMVMPLYLQEGVTVRVPDITDQPLKQAASIARRNQLLVISDGADYSDYIQKGMIASQKPISGTTVKPGRRIHVVISKGSRTVKMPDLSGLSPVDAEKVVQNVGLVMEKKRFRTSKRFASGTVMNQFPEAGAEIQAKAGVTIYIAR